jgi:hypothetical protein
MQQSARMIDTVILSCKVMPLTDYSFHAGRASPVNNHRLQALWARRI